MTATAQLDTSPPPTAEEQKHHRRVLSSSFLGSAVEYYDFLLYGTAASLVFGPLFFAGQSDAVALASSFATFAVGYLARPIGGIIFGQLGDRIGRKATLVTTMIMMGVASTAIGLLPTSEQIGTLAPILLLTLRLLQGFAVGGEWGGAALMAIEHSPTKRRGFSASFVNMGGPAGAVLSTLAFAAVTTLPDEQFFSWGWRVPFLFSAVLVIIALVIRLRVTESPMFIEAMKKQKNQPKREVAIVTIFKRYRKQLLLASGIAVSALAFQTFMATFAISMATNTGIDSTTVLLCKAFAAGLHVFSIGYFAHLSDRLGRKRVMVFGCIISIIGAFPLIMLLGSGSVLLVLIGFILGNTVLQASMYGPVAAQVSEMFGTDARYTGAGLSYQLAATVGGFTPFIATALWAVGRDNVAASGWEQYAITPIYLIGAVLVTLLALAFSKDGIKSDLRATTADKS